MCVKLSSNTFKQSCLFINSQPNIFSFTKMTYPSHQTQTKASFSDFEGKGITKETKSYTHSHTHKNKSNFLTLSHFPPSITKTIKD